MTINPRWTWAAQMDDDKYTGWIVGGDDEIHIAVPGEEGAKAIVAALNKVPRLISGIAAAQFILQSAMDEAKDRNVGGEEK